MGEKWLVSGNLIGGNKSWAIDLKIQYTYMYSTHTHIYVSIFKIYSRFIFIYKYIRYNLDLHTTGIVRKNNGVFESLYSFSHVKVLRIILGKISELPYGH